MNRRLIGISSFALTGALAAIVVYCMRSQDFTAAALLLTLYRSV